MTWQTPIAHYSLKANATLLKPTALSRSHRSSLQGKSLAVCWIYGLNKVGLHLDKDFLHLRQIPSL